MFLLFQLTVLGFCFYLGVLCIREPMKIVKILALYGQLIFGKHLSRLSTNSKLKEALLLIKDNPFEYEKRFSFQVMIVKQTGYAALFVSVVGACILTLANK